MASSVCGECSAKGTGLQLVLAAESGHTNCLESLIAAGADVNYGLDYYDAVFMDARIRSRSERSCWPTHSSTDGNIESYGSTALIIAMRYGRHVCLQSLINAGADVNAKSPSGKTALMEATASHNLEGVKLLFKSGAHVNLVDESGCNALTNYTKQQSIHRCYELSSLLMVAGETIDGNDMNLDLGRKLMHACRKAIRKHLRQVDPPVNLFVKIHRPGLPRALTSYLLYDVSLNGENVPEN